MGELDDGGEARVMGEEISVAEGPACAASTARAGGANDCSP